MNIKVNGVTISSPFGATEPFRNGIPHKGIDIPMEEGTILQAIQDGIVTKVFDGSGKIGEGVAIKAQDGTTHIFGHMSAVSVEPGQSLSAGDVIGLSGNTGASTGPHVHFATQLPSGEFADPTGYANYFGQMTEKGVYFGSPLDWFKNRGQVNNYDGAPETSAVMDWLTGEFHDFLLFCWDWFVFYLPDMLGYGTILAGIAIILSSMIGKGVVKPFAVWAAACILGICILISA